MTAANREDFAGQFVERLGAKLEKQTNVFKEVFYKGDLKMLGPKALLFLEEENLQELQKRLAEFRPFLANFSRATNLNSLFQIVNNQISSQMLMPIQATSWPLEPSRMRVTRDPFPPTAAKRLPRASIFRCAGRIRIQTLAAMIVPTIAPMCVKVARWLM